MNIIKRKKTKTEYSGAKVKLKSEKTHKRPEKKSFFKSKVKSTKKLPNRRKLKVNYLTIFAVFAGLLMLVGVVFGLYESAMWVVATRASKTDVEENVGEVLGFQNVPVYPQSEYIFTPTDEPDSVKEFTSTGRSIYRLDWDTDIDSVYEFYKEELPKEGWKHLLTVPRTSKDKMYGEYWISDDEEIGLRIYDRVNDIWYQKLTPEQAKNGLKDQLAKEIERELLISSGSGIDLLPDHPWQITIPNEYLIKYFPTDEGDLRGIQFLKRGTDIEYIFEPIAPIEGKFDDQLLEEYIAIFNLRLTAAKEPHNWEIISSQYKEFGGKQILEASVTSDEGTGLIYILRNQNFNYSYAFFQPHQENAFTQFFLQNIKEKRSEINYSTDFNF